MIRLSVLVTDKVKCNLTAFKGKCVTFIELDMEALVKLCESDKMAVSFEIQDTTVAATLSKCLGVEIKPTDCTTYFQDFQVIYIVTTTWDAEMLRVLCCTVSNAN